jgi:hypothetical protein
VTTSPAAAAAAAAVVALFVSACGPAWKSTPHDRRFQAAPGPAVHRRPASEWLRGDWWNRGFLSTVRPLARAVSPARWGTGLLGGRPALDVNAFSEVPDSTWFENRIGRRPVSPEEIERGPGTSEPAPGPLMVVSGKLEGATPGLVVRDSAGIVWFVKFDPPAYPELSTGAEIVAQRLLHAAGYLLPEMHVLDLGLDRFDVEPGSLRLDDYNRLVPLTRLHLRDLLTNLNPSASRRIRALVSRQLPGEPIGPFAYRGVRIDDPNDRIPHERRRSLRALWVLSAWLNNTDVRRQNTLDTFVLVDRERQLGYVRHHLIDFGDSLGSAGERDKYIGEGYEGHIDWPAMLRRLFGGGFGFPYWLAVERSPLPAVAVFEAEVFDPARWAPAYPNPAFDEATAEDTFWGASLLARFDSPRVAAAIRAARYGDPAAAEIILQVLLQRRAKLLRYAFRRMLPLVDPEVDGARLRFRDLELDAGLVAPDRAGYRFEVRWNRSHRPDVVLLAAPAKTPVLDLQPALARAHAAGGFAGDPFLTVTAWRPRHGRAGPRVELHLRLARGALLPIGLSRTVESR